jgi:PHS family inorganic phosphate transporter-like MFS transporter
LLLGFGALPAASVFYLRRTIAETPRFLAQHVPYEVSRVISDLTGFKEKLPHRHHQSLLSARWLKCLLGTAGSWFLLDVAFYGNGVSSTLILNTIVPEASLVRHTLSSALIFIFFAVPGYILAAKYVDQIGRKTLQVLGFFVMAACYFGIGAFPNLIQDSFYMFVAIFGLSFFFVNFGPNATTFLIPSEVFPTKIRARAHGISAATGKVGAFVGAFFLPVVLKEYGLNLTMFLVGIASLLGIFTTFLVPEMKTVSLETVEQMD